MIKRQSRFDRVESVSGAAIWVAVLTPYAPVAFVRAG